MNFLKRLPILPTMLVLIAVAIMVRLGFWQMDRADEKASLLARYAAIQQDQPAAAWDGHPKSGDEMLFRRVQVDCASAALDNPVAGHNVTGETGWSQIASCTTRKGFALTLVLGWSKVPQPFVAAQFGWRGGQVTGTVARDRGDSVRLIADPPLAGLLASERPDPANLPNNHWSYAVQWFLFAAVALVIYSLALRKRLAAKDAEG